MGSCCCKSNAVGDSESSGMVKRSPNTPIREYAVHDISFLAIFVFLVGIMAGMTMNGLMRGRPEIYTNGYDSWGNVCGMENEHLPGVEGSGMDRTDHKFIFFTAYCSLPMFSNPKNVLRENVGLPKFCVKQCPNETIRCREFLKEHGYKPPPEVVDRRICGVIPKELILKNKNIHNVCIPDILFLIDNVTEAISSGSATELMDGDLLGIALTLNLILNSVVDARNQIVIMAFVTIIMCLLAMVVIRMFVKCFVYITLALSFVIGAGCLGVLWYYYAMESGRIEEGYVRKRVSNLRNSDEVTYIENSTDADFDVAVVNVSAVLDNLNLLVLRESVLYLPFCIFATVVFVVLVLIFIWARKYIKLSIDLMVEACKAIFMQPPIILQPILTCLLYIAVFAFTLVVLAFIVSIVIYEVDEDGLVTYVTDPKQHIKVQMSLLIFICLSIIFFIKGCNKVIIADVISSYHFSDRNIVQRMLYVLFPVILPVIRLVRYNLGSVAIGAFALSAMKSLSIAISYCKRHLEECHLNQKCCCKKVLDCLQAFVRILDKAMSFMTHNAYICIAIYGYSFCKAAKRSVELIEKHATSMAVVHVVTTFLILIAKFSVCALIVFISWVYLSYTVEQSTQFVFVVPLIVIGILAALIIQCIFDLFSLAIATLFFCYWEDQERNDGTEIKPYYSTAELQGVMKSASAL